ncbi:cell division protein FtsZ [Quisquiliibacterium transsilvanicum]|uniref:Cell division protein FtsZ n=1 Tax=Quisquiliibacterium transsilvanicum TaxID=1549638 RepID=A0A7W8M977_9BURK|nr:cell division protein FtsZ [Quisquiliibacterium transsilvanicum]MBB5271769.1 cell division protein FtsZ [Quisquiliibacterium transsilvanicum]
MNFEMIHTDVEGAIIKVVGVGGAGGNAINHMIGRGVQGVEFIALNTDRQALVRSQAERILQLGELGLGAGASPDAGRAAAENARERIREALTGANMVFLTAGMGKGTGTGASPVVAEIAKELGILTVGVVTKPFHFEGNRKMQIAESGIDQLVQHVDSLIVVLNQNLFDVMDEDASLEDAFRRADDVLHNAVAGIAEIINVPGLVNVDFADVRTVMGEQGKAMMGIGEASGLDRARLAAEQAVASPLLDGVDLSGARGVIVNITANRSLKLRETNEVINTIKAFCAEDATIIHGTVFDEAMEDRLRVTVVATGIGRQASAGRPVLVQAPALRTGTDNAPVGGHGDYGRLDQPAIWRNPRASAAAQVAALQESGVERFDIPAFLRKQAD